MLLTATTLSKIHDRDAHCLAALYKRSSHSYKCGSTQLSARQNGQQNRPGNTSSVAFSRTSGLDEWYTDMTLLIMKGKPCVYAALICSQSYQIHKVGVSVDNSWPADSWREGGRKVLLDDLEPEQWLRGRYDSANDQVQALTAHWVQLTCQYVIVKGYSWMLQPSAESDMLNKHLFILSKGKLRLRGNVIVVKIQLDGAVDDISDNDIQLIRCALGMITDERHI
ncbi:hypothetical protein NP233_g6212 [Leucocoprinus birnbaumii]|uniref:Uncharacterized protein n=1 Tax=Leucocoprinus birnbaumii TaxID=56174 RepID=A0AAD5VRF0_9AGAR|nr:hypothetical protein NP233_g6212 [Leucocoprinus birnbaumii]